MIASPDDDVAHQHQHQQQQRHTFTIRLKPGSMMASSKSSASDRHRKRSIFSFGRKRQSKTAVEAPSDRTSLDTTSSAMTYDKSIHTAIDVAPALPQDAVRIHKVNNANSVVSGSGLSAMVTGEVLHAMLEPGGQYFDDPVMPGIHPSSHPMAKFPPDLWNRIAHFLPTRIDAANLVFATLKVRGQQVDAYRPSQLSCFVCGTHHDRLNPGKECLRANYVTYPIFDCPNAKILTLPRMRLVEGRQLPYSLVQLAMRRSRYGTTHGISLEALNRRWRCKDSDWSHISRAHVYKGHLLIKVTSTVHVRAEMTPSEERLLLFSRNDYAPYFSCCHHWANGKLMPLVKCSLSHTPIPRQGIRSQWADGPNINYKRLKTPDYMPHLCEQCRPMRRCPECPSEYLVELKLVEDRRAQGIDRFRHALVVTRWSDLGDGTSPLLQNGLHAMATKPTLIHSPP